MNPINVTFKNVVTATLRVDNSQVENRKFDITAEAIISGNTVSEFINGSAVLRSDPSVYIGFQENQSPYFNLWFNGTKDITIMKESVDDIEAFISSVRSSIPNLGLNND